MGEKGRTETEKEGGREIPCTILKAFDECRLKLWKKRFKRNSSLANDNR